MSLRRSVLLALLPVTLVGCDAPTSPDDPEPPALPESVAAMYQRDAARLALRDVARQQPIQEGPIELPSVSVRGYERALAWLYHSSGPARDSVVDVFGIHTWPAPELHEVIVTVDDTHAWTTKWRLRQSPTGNAAIDQLVSKYQLQVLSWQPTSPSGASVLLSTQLAVNAAALGKSFVGIPGVRGGYPNIKGGAGNDIQGEEQDGQRILTFSRGWGDCMAGCLYRHYWRFRVGTNGDVAFLGSDGPEVP